jgi:hypothetical protein
MSMLHHTDKPRPEVVRCKCGRRVLLTDEFCTGQVVVFCVCGRSSMGQARGAKLHTSSATPENAMQFYVEFLMLKTPLN